jgi:DNA repair protein RecN (Recombination protein N)
VLLELAIENYAVIDRLRVRFHQGLNLLTGETGSGKSIVVDALALLLGARATTDMIRTGENRARIAGIFDVQGRDDIRAVLDPAGFEPEEGELLIEREILAGGKSRAYIASRPVALTLLKELAPRLADIHGQHDQQLLFSRDAQLQMLDSFAGTANLLLEIGEIYRNWRQAGVELDELERTEQEKLRLLDLWQFQRKEIEAANLQPGEEAALQSERKVLQNLGRVQDSAGTAYAALYDSPESATSLVRVAARRVDELCRIDESLSGVREQVQSAEIALQEASYALRDYLGRLEANPGRLDEIESRLGAIDRLKRKYGGSVDEILAFLEDVRSRIDAIEHSGERAGQLRAARLQLEAEYGRRAARLSSRRREFAEKLKKRVETELAALAMAGTVFDVRFSPSAWTKAGADSVEFLVSPNPGEDPRPLEKVASGGEISRIALALKTSVAERAGAGATRTLVFDEVDAGIGGGAAEGVGRRLKQLSIASQVLCVTHLPQIAAFADHHYRVDKRDVRGRTVAVVEELDGSTRLREVGRMLSGQRLTAEALKHAEQLLHMAGNEH